jgi:hypothetical protein
MRARTDFAGHFREIGRSTLARKFSLSFFRKSCYAYAVSRVVRGADRDRHGRCAWDAVGVPGCSVIIRADEQPDAHGEIVWS